MAGDDDEPLAHPHHPGVIAVVRAVLLENRWPKREIEEGIGDVEVRAWASEGHPTTLGAWKALGRKIAKDLAIDRTRSEMVDGKHATQPTDRADEAPAHGGLEAVDASIDRRRAIQEIAAQLAPEERPVFERWALGSTQAEIASELAMSPRAVSRQVSTMRARFQRALAPVGLMAVLSVGAYLLLRDKLRPDDQAHHGPPSPSTEPTAPPGPSPEQLAQEKRAKADDLRRLASADCAAGRWSPCSIELSDAFGLDPAGAHARGVKRLAAKANRGLIEDEFESKPGAGGRTLSPAERKALVAAIGGARGQALALVCAPGAEPTHLCNLLSAAITSAGWTVTRQGLAPDAAVTHGMAIEVATDADDPTEDAADALATGLEQAFLKTRGPDDAAPGGEAPLRLTVGAP